MSIEKGLGEGGVSQNTGETQRPSRLTRRELLRYAGAAAIGGVAVGGVGGFFLGHNAGVDQGYYKRYSQEQSEIFDITSEPYNLQIVRFESRFHNADLIARKDVRDHIAYLLSLWYGHDKTQGVFARRDVPFAVADRIYSAIEFITDEKDERLKGFEDDDGWALPGEYIRINLTSPTFQKVGGSTSSKAPIAPITALRDVLSHEMTHFITISRGPAESFSLIKEMKGEYAQMADIGVFGFEVLFKNSQGESVSVYSDFDELVTEVISKYWQNTSRMGLGLSFYSEDVIPEAEKKASVLEAVLTLAEISVEDLATFHAYSDLDGFAKRLGEKVDRTASDREKIKNGLVLIEAITSGQLIHELRVN